MLVLNFYYQSNWFNDHHTYQYSFWKVTPIVFLVFVSFLKGETTGGYALIFGAIGDWIIGIRADGIIPGAFAFGIGHFLYMKLLSQHSTRIHNPFQFLMLLWAVFVVKYCYLPLLPEHKIPVAVFSIYSLALSRVTLVAVSQYLNQSKTLNKSAAIHRAIGFLLFYISDSFIILTHVGIWTFYSNQLVLSTYYLAQFLILFGNLAAKNQDIKVE
ncbi:unnamed protein product [Caenorhabditis angaria]|uniref:lysoplasmalogenase n=1 Tax=Caenorhabditis angaria TaxID=860376 RepID=A0A9P1IAJ4_9PELO|nr:unnamed protein product [Caenorhabditis angaria]